MAPSRTLPSRNTRKDAARNPARTALMQQRLCTPQLKVQQLKMLAVEGCDIKKLLSGKATLRPVETWSTPEFVADESSDFDEHESSSASSSASLTPEWSPVMLPRDTSPVIDPLAHNAYTFPMPLPSPTCTSPQHWQQEVRASRDVAEMEKLSQAMATLSHEGYDADESEGEDSNDIERDMRTLRL
ncbi:hypothetical protein CYLTODRAFT_488802 [Cylindrobasidium torrendii FP15055 ss-10]|uniref:Uncharacterized protein n=1 Tax=Cylindrobasidium torrendii FP15055 ss-10 TaxID=1314674 RepID=A0A0D7BHG0_9AGAR|nr:hypothetical protein CYLTODRAFT_488802 [Cylindrobasidium torrendii FP15055 ss-10]